MQAVPYSSNFWESPPPGPVDPWLVQPTLIHFVEKLLPHWLQSYLTPYVCISCEWLDVNTLITEILHPFMFGLIEW